MKDLIVNMTAEMHDYICGPEIMDMLRQMSLEQLQHLDKTILTTELPRIKQKSNSLDIGTKVRDFYNLHCRHSNPFTNEDGQVKRYIFTPEFKMQRGFEINRYGKVVRSGV